MITLKPVKLQCVVISQSIRMSVCLSVREHISLETCVQPFTSSKSRRVLRLHYFLAQIAPKRGIWHQKSPKKFPAVTPLEPLSGRGRPPPAPIPSMATRRARGRKLSRCWDLGLGNRSSKSKFTTTRMSVCLSACTYQDPDVVTALNTYVTYFRFCGWRHRHLSFVYVIKTEEDWTGIKNVHITWTGVRELCDLVRCVCSQSVWKRSMRRDAGLCAWPNQLTPRVTGSTSSRLFSSAQFIS